jgi:hypothetical protein
MLTQNRPLNSTTVTAFAVPHSPNLDIFLAGNKIGTIESLLVCDLHTDDRATAEALGLKGGDDCYLYDGQVYTNHGSATAQVVANHLAATAHW